MQQSSKRYNIAGKPRVYRTDGSGRDTYVGFDNGGNTKMYSPSKGCYTQFGKFSATATAQFNYPKQSSAAIKTVHYHADGTGRDTYINCDQGGYMTNYGWHKQENSYVTGLREYGTTVQSTQAALAAQSKGRNGVMPMKDFFVEGQVSIRHPQWRQKLSKTMNHQSCSVERLAVPRKSVEHFRDLVNSSLSGLNATPQKKGEFLRSNREINFSPVTKKLKRVQIMSPEVMRSSSNLFMAHNAQ